MYDLEIKGGAVIDPAQQIHTEGDIGISEGRIACLAKEIAPDTAKRVINASGKIVTPGLIDIKDKSFLFSCAGRASVFMTICPSIHPQRV